MDGDEQLRLEALEALGPHGDEVARDALEGGELTTDAEAATWQASSGSMRGLRVALALPDDRLARARASHAAVDALTAAIAAAIAQRSEHETLLDLRLVARTARRGSPYR